MAVTFDVVGPGATGQGSIGATTVTWTHTVTGGTTNTAILVGVAVDANPDTMTLTCTCAGTTMTPLALVHSDNAALGYIRVFGLAGVATGANTILATATATPVDLNGGSLSFGGVSQTTPFGTPATNFGSSTTATAATAGSTSGNIVAGFICNGSNITSATSPSTSQFIENYNAGGQAAGKSAGATSPSTGSAVTMAWTVVTDFWAEIVVEVLAAGGGALSTAGGSRQTIVC